MLQKEAKDQLQNQFSQRLEGEGEDEEEEEEGEHQDYSNPISDHNYSAQDIQELRRKSKISKILLNLQKFKILMKKRTQKVAIFIKIIRIRILIIINQNVNVSHKTLFLVSKSNSISKHDPQINDEI